MTEQQEQEARMLFERVLAVARVEDVGGREESIVCALEAVGKCLGVDLSAFDGCSRFRMIMDRDPFVLHKDRENALADVVGW